MPERKRYMVEVKGFVLVTATNPKKAQAAAEIALWEAARDAGNDEVEVQGHGFLAGKPKPVESEEDEA